jgi:hypothetical protein
VGWGEDAQFGGVPEGVRQVVEKSRDGLSDTDGCEDAGTEEGIAAESIVKGVLGARDVSMDPREIRQLL